MYPPYSFDKQVKLFLNNKLSENDTPKENSNKENITYYKLPNIRDISVRTKEKIGQLHERFCKKTDIIIVLTPFKIGSLFSSKDSLLNTVRSFVVYKFTCAGCPSCYIGETRRHLATRVKDHLLTKSHTEWNTYWRIKPVRVYVTKVVFKSLIILLLLLGWKLRRLYTLTGWILTWINKKNM